MSERDPSPSAHGRPPHPFLYFLLFLPFGASSGFIMVTVGSLAGKAGLPDEVIGGLVATNTLPHTWKFMWAPLVDTVWTGRGWYITSNVISSLAIMSIGFVPIRPDTVTLLTAIVFFNGLSTTFIGMCTEALMARLTPPEQRGSAGGWSQAGNLGGATLGGLGLLLAENTRFDWLPSVVIGGLLLSCSLALAFVKEPPRPVPRPRFIDSLIALWNDILGLLTDSKRRARLPGWAFGFPLVWLYVLSAAGILAITLSLMPIGSGGAQNLFAAMAPDWKASPGLVSVANGLLSGGIAILGCLGGGWLSTKLDKRVAYAVSGVALALVAFAMALAPRTPAMYAGGVILYSFALGLCYATFTAFVLDIIGHTGGATKYNVFASMANLPIYLMGRVDGHVATAHGRTAMLWVDGLAGIGGAVILMVVVTILRRKRAVMPPAVELPTATVVTRDAS